MAPTDERDDSSPPHAADREEPARADSEQQGEADALAVPSGPEHRGVPWDAPGGRPLAALGRTLSESVARPSRFFQKVAEVEDRWAAFGFALALDVVGHVLALGWIWLFTSTFDTLALIAVVLSPLRVLIFVWLGSELVHSTLRILKGTGASRAVTHRTTAYCYGLATAYRNVVLVPVIEVLALVLPDETVGPALDAVVLVGFFLVPLVAYQSMAIRFAHRTSGLKASVSVVAAWALMAGGALLVFLSGGGLEGSE